MFAYVNHDQIRSCNQPVLKRSVSVYNFLLNETTGTFDLARTHEWPITSQMRYPLGHGAPLTPLYMCVLENPNAKYMFLC